MPVTPEMEAIIGSPTEMDVDVQLEVEPLTWLSVVSVGKVCPTPMIELETVGSVVDPEESARRQISTMALGVVPSPAIYQVLWIVQA